MKNQDSIDEIVNDEDIMTPIDNIDNVDAAFVEMVNQDEEIVNEEDAVTSNGE